MPVSSAVCDMHMYVYSTYLRRQQKTHSEAPIVLDILLDITISPKHGQPAADSSEDSDSVACVYISDSLCPEAQSN